MVLLARPGWRCYSCLMSDRTASTQPPPTLQTDAEQLQQLRALVGAIARKAATRFEGDPAAVELVELARKAEDLVAEMLSVHIQ